MSALPGKTEARVVPWACWLKPVVVEPTWPQCPAVTKPPSTEKPIEQRAALLMKYGSAPRTSNSGFGFAGLTLTVDRVGVQTGVLGEVPGRVGVAGLGHQDHLVAGRVHVPAGQVAGGGPGGVELLLRRVQGLLAALDQDRLGAGRGDLLGRGPIGHRDLQGDAVLGEPGAGVLAAGLSRRAWPRSCRPTPRASPGPGPGRRRRRGPGASPRAAAGRRPPPRPAWRPGRTDWCRPSRAA